MDKVSCFALPVLMNQVQVAYLCPSGVGWEEENKYKG